jgi:hypothetical protein
MATAMKKVWQYQTCKDCGTGIGHDGRCCCVNRAPHAENLPLLTERETTPWDRGMNWRDIPTAGMGG